MREKSQKFNVRQEMAVQSYEIFHYRDARMDGVAVHHHDFYEVYFLLSGNVEYSIEGRKYHLEAGDLLLVSPQELHQSHIHSDAQPYERIVLWLNPSFVTSFSAHNVCLTRCFDRSLPTHSNLIRLSPPQRANVLAQLGALVRESYGDAYAGPVAATGILLQFLVELNRIALQCQPARQIVDRSAPLMERVLDYINQYYVDEISLDALAARFFVSKYHLSHEFNRVVGTSVYRYIILKRLIIAKQMLAAGVAPTDVYRNCGFKDYANFYRTFKGEYGVSPKQFASNFK